MNLLPSRAHFVRAAGALGALAASGVPVIAQPVTLQIAITPADPGAEAVYARDGGFFKDVGIDAQLTVIANSGAMGSAVAGGSMALGPGNPLSIASAHAQGLPFTVIAPSALYSATEPAQLLVVAKSGPLNGPRDLEGKTIATVELKGIMEASIRAWMAKAGADPNKAHFIELPFATMGAAVTEGRVDAAMIAEPALTAALATTRSIGSPYAAIADEWYVNVWFTTQEWVAKNTALARRFASAMDHTAAWANTHRPQTAPMLQRVSHLSDDVLAKMTRTRFATGHTDPALIAPVIETATKYGILKVPVRAADLIAPGF